LVGIFLGFQACLVTACQSLFEWVFSLGFKHDRSQLVGACFSGYFPWISSLFVSFFRGPQFFWVRLVLAHQGSLQWVFALDLEPSWS
jgi:hypothetical protein